MKNTKIKLPQFAKTIINKLTENGYKAYAVGGFVRDCLLQIPSADIDITTSATPTEVNQIFKKKYIVLKTGIKHGTVTIMKRNDYSRKIEVTTFRSEKSYSDNRHPDEVIFETNIEDDLSRRDLTINSIAYNDIDGIVDLYGGIEDLKNKRIKTVGDANKRYQEDALRMLRTIRFASRLKFEIEENTFNSIKKNAHLINNISKERIQNELNKMLLCDKPSTAFFLMQKSGLLKEILPDIDIMTGFDQKNPAHKYDLLTHSLYVVDRTKPILELRIAALLHDVGKPHHFTIDKNGIGHFYGHEKTSAIMTPKILESLRYSKKIKTTATKLVAMHQINPFDVTDRSLNRIVNELGEENALLLANLQYADSSTLTLKTEHIFTNKLKEFLKKQKRFSRRDLAINGNDLQKIGLKGYDIGVVLDYLTQLVIDNKIQNKKDALLNHVKEFL